MNLKKYFYNKIVVITGASSGIGEAIAQLANSFGAKVYGLCKSKTNDALENVVYLSCDVRNKEQANSVISEIINKEKSIDILINNAGLGISGAVENATNQDVNLIVDTNLLGVVNVTQAVLPYMRVNKNGKIINISSVAAIFPIPFQGFYSATKAAVLLLSESLRMEVQNYGIQVGVILPGDVKTNFTKNRVKSVVDSVYKERETKAVSSMERDEINGLDKFKVAEQILKTIAKKHVPPRKIIGAKYKIFVLLNKLLPRNLVLKIVNKMY